VTADPRVEAVADALWKDDACGNTRDHYRALAVVAVAALDAHDGPKFSSVVHECCERPTEADLRKRIAQEIGQEWQRRSDEWGYRVDSHQEGVLDGLAEAEEIAGGDS